MEIPLSQGKVALIDDEDFELVSQYKWCYSIGYAITNVCINGRHTTMRMHRLITGAPKGMDVDHKNHDKLDNRKTNLRVCTRSENMQNLKFHSNVSSKYKGVCWDKRSDKWCAKIVINYHTINLGRFNSEEEAARAYNLAAAKYFGDFAYLNEVKECTSAAS